MSDLISRKALLQQLRTDEALGFDDFYETVENSPIAYDVETVVEGLELENKRLKTLKNNCIALCDHEVIGIENKAYDYAIKIVKGAVRDE